MPTNTTTHTKSFDPAAFRATHRVDLLDPIGGSQLRLADRPQRNRVSITGPSGTTVYDSQKTLGEAGLFDPAMAHDHAQGWIEAQIRHAELVEALSDQRRYQLADVDALSHQQQADLSRQRTALTGEIKKHDRLRKRLADEARSPEVKVEYVGPNRWDVFAAPSVFDGQLDADGNMLVKPRPVEHTPAPEAAKPKAKRSRKPKPGEHTVAPPISESSEPLVDDQPCDTKVPFEHDEPIATATRHADGSLSVELHSGEVTFEIAHVNGLCPAATLVRRLEAHPTILAETLTMIALGEWSAGGKYNRRQILVEYLEPRLAMLPLDDRGELTAHFDRQLTARTGDPEDPSAAFAAAKLLTDADPDRIAVPRLLEMIRAVEDPAVLAWLRDVEEKRPEVHGPRSKPRAKVIETITSQLGAVERDADAPPATKASDEVFA